MQAVDDEASEISAVKRKVNVRTEVVAENSADEAPIEISDEDPLTFET